MKFKEVKRVKEFVNSFTNYLFVLKNAQNGGKHGQPDITNETTDTHTGLLPELIQISPRKTI